MNPLKLVEGLKILHSGARLGLRRASTRGSTEIVRAILGGLSFAIGLMPGAIRPELGWLMR